MKAHKWKKLIDVFYWVFIFGMLFLYLLSDNIKLSDFHNAPVIPIIINFLVMTFFIMVKYFLVTIVYLASIFYLNRLKFKIDKTDLVKEKSYYRDKINEYSPGVLSYIDNYVVGNETLVATIMYLELKGLIKTNNKLEVTDIKPSDLDKNALYVYNLIKTNDLVNFSPNSFNNFILKDCIKHELIIEGKKLLKIKFKNIGRWIIIKYILLFINAVLSNFDISIPIFVVVSLLITIVLFLYVAFVIALIFVGFIISAFIIKRPYYDNYKRTDLGMEINTRLNGLNNFIKDFSILDERTKKELLLWKEYLLYSVMFNHNKKTINDYQKIIENTKH